MNTVNSCILAYLQTRPDVVDHIEKKLTLALVCHGELKIVDMYDQARLKGNVFVKVYITLT